jgi:hypothetical protein
MPRLVIYVWIPLALTIALWIWRSLDIEAHYNDCHESLFANNAGDFLIAVIGTSVIWMVYLAIMAVWK